MANVSTGEGVVVAGEQVDVAPAVEHRADRDALADVTDGRFCLRVGGADCGVEHQMERLVRGAHSDDLVDECPTWNASSGSM